MMELKVGNTKEMIKEIRSHKNVYVDVRLTVDSNQWIRVVKSDLINTLKISQDCDLRYEGWSSNGDLYFSFSYSED